MGRGAAFSTISIKALTQHISDILARHGIKSHLPNFWVQALLDLKNIGLTELTLSRDGALYISPPSSKSRGSTRRIWYSRKFPLRELVTE
jgi:hypothetical protein